MKGKYIFLLIAAMSGTFVAGVGAHMGYTQIQKGKAVAESEAQPTQEEQLFSQIEVRILDGYVEWFDGTEWNRTEKVETLKEKDPYVMAQQAFEAFEERYQAELEQKNQLAAEKADAAAAGPLVGVETKDEKKPDVKTEKPAKEQSGTTESPSTSGGGSTSAPSTPSTPQQPATPSTPQVPETPVQPETPTEPETPVQPETPSQPETPVQPETPAEPDAGTGDGEDVEWSDDYL